MKKPMIYLAHPVSGDAIENAYKAAEWIRWLTLNDPARLYIAPWVAEVIGFGEGTLGAGFYQHVLDDDAVVVSHCDGVLAVGGKWTSGMLQERAVARILGKAVVDLTQHASPPSHPAAVKAFLDETVYSFPGGPALPLSEDDIQRKKPF